MTDPDEGLKQLMDEDYAREIILGDGGVEVFLKEMEEFHEAVTRLWDEYDALIEKHPDKWVVMGKDRVLAVCDSHKEVLSTVEPLRARGDAYIVEFSGYEPRVLWSCDSRKIRRLGGSTVPSATPTTPSQAGEVDPVSRTDY